MTEAERKLWHALKAHRFQSLRIRLQVPMGRYIADLVCHRHRLVIEVDGGQHSLDANAVRDQARDAWFEAQGYRVVRFWNGQVMHEFESVLDTIHARVFLDAATSTDAPSPPLRGRDGEGGSGVEDDARAARLSVSKALYARRPPSLPSPAGGEGFETGGEGFETGAAVP